MHKKMRRFFRFYFLYIFAICFITQSSISAFGSDFHSARTAALAGSGHAGPLLNDSVFLNPSYASFLPTYSLALQYLKFSGPSRPGESDYHGRNYSVSIQDGRNELFQAGVAY